MLRRMAGAIALTLLVACSSENRTGLPETDTTGTAQSRSRRRPRRRRRPARAAGRSARMTPADKEWVTKAGMGGLAEVQTGNLALQKAQNADVKAFAQRMVTDHRKANEELEQLATTKGLTLPAQLDGDHKRRSIT